MKKHIRLLSLTLLTAILLSSCQSGTTETEPVENLTDTTPVTEAVTEPPETEPIVLEPLERPAPVADRKPYTLADDWTYLGTGVGVNPGRVVSVHNDKAFLWKGHGYWYMSTNFNITAVDEMVASAICTLAGVEDINRALDLLFAECALRLTGEATPYQPGQKIAIKTNMNIAGTSMSTANNTSGYYPAPVTLKALLKILVAYGVKAEDITVFDASRAFPTYLTEYCSDGALSKVNFVCLDKGKARDAKADTTKPVLWSFDIANDGHEPVNGYPSYNTSYYPTCVTEADYLINLSCLRGHYLAGITVSAKNHFGTIMPGFNDKNGKITFPDPFRTNPPSYAGIHKYVAAQDYFMEPKELWTCPKRDYGTYTVLVDLLSHRDCGAKTMLYLCDGLAATIHQQSTLTMSERWYTFAKDGEPGWTGTILASQDPVAIDSVALDYILAEQAASEAVGDYDWDGSLPDGHTADNYLIEAALAYNPPSGITYQDGYGNPISSLGVHEHWNNAEEKAYTGNTTPGVGIEHIVVEK